jgi:hypothetical protein
VTQYRIRSWYIFRTHIAWHSLEVTQEHQIS